MICEKLSAKKQKNARQRAHKILNEIQQDFEIKTNYKFDRRIVGSGHWGTMMKDANGRYDIDYQILLTKNSNSFIVNNCWTPTIIKNNFFSSFQRHQMIHEKIENSTTSITILSENYNFHLDFVIIDATNMPNQIIRRNIKKENPSINEFTWNQLPNRSDAFDYFKNMEAKDRQRLVNERIIPEKWKEKQKGDENLSKISSSDIFVREVMNWKYANER